MSMTLPPGPRLPMPVQTLLWVMRPIDTMDRWHRRYGDAFTVRLPFNGAVVNVADPALVRAVFKGDPAVLHAGAANAVLEPLLGRHSVLILDGPAHLRQRRLMLPPFHGERMQRYGDVITEVTDAAIDAWPVGRGFPLHPAMQSITLDVILRTVFGVDEAERLTRMRTLVLDLLRVAQARLSMLPWLRHDLGPRSPWGRFLRSRARLDEALYTEIARGRRDPQLEQREDVMALLLRARDEEGRPLGDTELRDELMTLLLAGHETTATALAWAFDLLLHHPAALRRLQDDLDAGGTAHLDAVIRETLRLRPVVAVVGRLLREPVDLGGMRLPAGVVVSPNIHLVHHRADVYPDPDAFRPERFLDGGAPDPYAWLPFGGGIRRCLGAAFATYEMRVVIPTVLARTRMRALRPDPEAPRRRAVTMVPAHGVPVVLEERRPAVPRRAGAREQTPVAAG